ncbi:autotransporter outer membrane beta-barrel domain-containing protein [Phascolarctobacterium faecium]|nr:autotransporter outer membrane beta-barrel domain-containing protein [Phascolarctobacterium faecium]MDM8110584.1 autotransporter outer membrane beta-barrel domain-containing protein [Phascolarctobacterium faecium]
MARKKNLERAIVLGLILSTGVYGSAWAEPIEAVNNENSSEYTSVILDTSIEINDGDNGNIVLDNAAKHTVSITANGEKSNISLKGENTAIWVADDILAGTTVALKADGDIIIDADNGIQANAKAREDENVSQINLTAKHNKITANNIGIYSTGGVDVLLNAESNEIISKGEYGIQATQSSDGKLNLIATNGNNTVKAENGTAIRANGEKVITLDASGNNIVIGGIYGIENTETNQFIKTHNKIYTDLDAVNNIIYGTDTAIKSDGLGITDIKADQNNNIGFLTNDKGEITDIAQTGINVTEGTVKVTAAGNNIIYGSNVGVSVSGENSKSELNAINNIITVTGENDGAIGVYAENGAEKVIVSDDKAEVNVTANAGDVYGILAETAGNININANNSIDIKVDCVDNLNDKYTTETYGIYVDKDSSVSLTTNSEDINILNNISEKGDGLNANNGIVSEGKVTLDSGNDINIYTYSGGSSADDRVAIENNGVMTLYADSNLNIISENIGDNTNTHINRGIYTNNDSMFDADINGSVEITSNGASAIGIQSDFSGGSIEINAGEGIVVNAIGHGAISPTGGSMEVDSYGVWNSGNGTVKLDTEGQISITASNDNPSTDPSFSLVAGVVGLNFDGSNETILDGSDVDITAISNGYLTYGVTSQYSKNAKVKIFSDKDTTIKAITDFGQSYAVNVANGNIKIESNRDSIIEAFRNNEEGEAIAISTEVIGTDYENVISIESNRNTLVYASNIAVFTDGENSKVNIEANTGSNIVAAGDILNGYGKSYAINAIGQSDVDLTAGETNLLRGAIYASGSTGTDKTDVTLGGTSNMVLSNAYIANAGGLKDKNVISALYAEKGAHIELDGDYNLLGTYADSESPDLERVVWAYDTADINITGLTAISTDSYHLAIDGNSKDIAVAAGTATGLEKLTPEEILDYRGDRANVDINYESDSSITGDILSAYAGTVNITANGENTRAASDAKIDIRGNLLAGNNGILNVDLGNGGKLTGRADDYGDAGLNTGHGAVDGENSFFNPAFSSEIKANGTVNLTMGKGSRWDVTGQSWITSLTTTGNAEDTLISLEKAKEDLNSNASALTIGSLTGNTRFYMNLDGDRSASDMLYIKNAQGIDGGTAHYNIYLQDDVTSAEINTDGTKAFNGLRFATVGTGSNVDFTVKSQGTGSAFDVEYEVDTDSYVNNSENSDYNSTIGGDANVEKPGDDSVNDFFGLSNSGTQEDTTETVANNIMPMAENEEVVENVAANNNTGLDEVTNFKIVKRLGEELNDTGKTILNMSRANYSNAIYMDRLNKRLGEARYINSEEDEGMWVRIRHDRIGKDAAYRSQNTMYELGYDQKQECDNGERRVGIAIDYMHGDTGYDQIAGKGEIDRYGLWLYDTWMGDKGHYADYVAKWGHLSNDFEVYTMNDKTKQVTGDYSNNVFSVSAEYGRKKDIGNDWYFEPQVQAQLARVTGADYTTNQGTKVSVDGINSLIGRAGFRLGKDFGEEKQSTVYIKADVLHEFLGDQDVRVLDKSSDNKWAGISYENEGTWYDVGFGFAIQMSKNSYAFMDFEKSFGNDNDETYQINVGMQWSF